MGWKDGARRVADWTLPPVFQNLLLLGFRRFRSALRGHKKLLLPNGDLRDKHAGERCFIIATGPSLSRQDLTLLRGEHCIGVSNLFVHPDFQTIRPQYYCVAGYHPPISEEAWRQWLVEMAARTDQATMFFSLADRVRAESVFAGRQVHYMDFGGSPANRSLDLAEPLPGAQSVSVMALMVALHLGFQEIYLLGCDHDWILHVGNSRHFYDEQEHTLNRAGYNEWFGRDFASYCQDYVNLWQQYRLVDSVARNRGVRIYNATDGGLLDVFPRRKLESVVSSR